MVSLTDCTHKWRGGEGQRAGRMSFGVAACACGTAAGVSHGAWGLAGACAVERCVDGTVAYAKLEQPLTIRHLAMGSVESLGAMNSSFM